MPLIKHGAFAEDHFVSVADGDPMPLNGTIVSLVRFQRDRETLLARNSQLGVQLKSSESPGLIGEDVHRLAVIVMEFPVFRDGRPFSHARLLRTRMNYIGEIRASGHFLYDQIAFATRVGFDAFDVPDGFSLPRYARALHEMSFVYQPSADGRRTIRDLRA
ncbi:MAG TPA: DUF934 domain-containing protein [Rhizomicrobium sp.]|jgi:uncharacterized protein (DUF934 family)